MKQTQFIRICLLTIFLLQWNGNFATAENAKKLSEKRIFTLENFSFQGRQAWIKQPRNPMKGNPWVWRAHFPNWHTDIDSVLLSKGVRIVYVNTTDMLANDTAMQVWDDFYKFLTIEKHFSKKVVLEGVSRGGFYAYTWAKRHPDKIVAIYAEAPVCDTKSWPLGLYSTKPDTIQAKNFLVRHNFKTVDEAKLFTNNSFDNLEELAHNQVPVIHAIGLNDKIVPPEENSFLLINKYIRMGGIATVIPCTSGKEELEGHHFEIDKFDLIANLLLEYITQSSVIYKTKK